MVAHASFFGNLHGQPLSDVGLKGANASEVVDYALRNKFILVTLDKDFGYIYYQIY